MPGIFQVLGVDRLVASLVGGLYQYLHLRGSSPLSRIQREMLATDWPEYDLPEDTRAMLRYGSKLTETPSFVGDEDVATLRKAGWSDRAIWEITALASFFNFSGRMEAVSGLPPGEIPESEGFREARDR